MLLHRVHKDTEKEEETLYDTQPAYSLGFVIDLLKSFVYSRLEL